MIIIFGGPLFKLPEWTEPEQADESFYDETREKLAVYPDLKFEPEISFWKSYWLYFIVFFIFLGSGIYLFSVRSGKTGMADATGIALFLICICLYPTIFGITKIIYFLRYRKAEREYHIRFLDAVKGSTDYHNFVNSFYKSEKIADSSESWY